MLHIFQDIRSIFHSILCVSLMIHDDKKNTSWNKNDVSVLLCAANTLQLVSFLWDKHYSSTRESLQACSPRRQNVDLPCRVNNDTGYVLCYRLIITLAREPIPAGSKRSSSFHLVWYPNHPLRQKLAKNHFAPFA